MSYGSEVLADAPLGYWKLDEASGDTFADASGNGWTLVAHSSYVAPDTGADTAPSGIGGLAVVLAASSLENNDGPFLPALGAITVEYWLKNPNYENFGSSAFDFGNDNFDRIQCHCPWSDGVVYWDYGQQADRVTATYATYANPEEWAHVVLTGDGVNDSIYLNNVLAVSGGQGLPGNDHLGVRLGNFQHAFFLDGASLSNFAVYDYVLDDTRIGVHYNAGVGATPPPPSTSNALGTLGVG